MRRAGLAAMACPLLLLGCSHVAPLGPVPDDQPVLLTVHGRPAPSGRVTLMDGAVHRTGQVALFRDSVVWEGGTAGPPTRIAVPVADVLEIRMRDPHRGRIEGLAGGALAGIVVAGAMHGVEPLALSGPIYAAPAMFVGYLVGYAIGHRESFRP